MEEVLLLVLQEAHRMASVSYVPSVVPYHENRTFQWNNFHKGIHQKLLFCPFEVTIQCWGVKMWFRPPGLFCQTTVCLQRRKCQLFLCIYLWCGSVCRELPVKWLDWITLMSTIRAYKNKSEVSLKWLTITFHQTGNVYSNSMPHFSNKTVHNGDQLKKKKNLRLIFF